MDNEDMEIPELKDGNEDAPSMEDKYGKRSGKYNLWPHKPLDYLHLFATNNKEDKEDILEMPQMNMKQGLKFFWWYWYWSSEKGNAAIAQQKSDGS